LVIMEQLGSILAGIKHRKRCFGCSRHSSQQQHPSF
jgi:hypothetical protein